MSAHMSVYTVYVCVCVCVCPCNGTLVIATDKSPPQAARQQKNIGEERGGGREIREGCRGKERCGKSEK